MGFVASISEEMSKIENQIMIKMTNKGKFFKHAGSFVKTNVPAISAVFTRMGIRFDVQDITGAAAISAVFTSRLQ